MANTATDVHGRKFNTGGHMNGRKTGGFSLRLSLELQGVTSERAMQRHLNHVYRILTRVHPGADITRYRVNADNPNAAPTAR